jgi:hypothetical protein
MPVKIEFGGSSDSEDEREERKEENVELTKENYRDLFPTLG